MTGLTGAAVGGSGAPETVCRSRLGVVALVFLTSNLDLSPAISHFPLNQSRRSAFNQIILYGWRTNYHLTDCGVFLSVMRSPRASSNCLPSSDRCSCRALVQVCQNKSEQFTSHGKKRVYSSQTCCIARVFSRFWKSTSCR